MTAPEHVLVAEVSRFMSEGQSGTDAWRQVLHRPRRPALAAAEVNAQARAKALNASDAKTLTNTSIQAIQPGRQDATIPVPERKPGESDLDWRQRVKRHIAGLAKPAGRVAEQAPTSAGFAEKSEEAYQRLKAAELSSDASRIREIMHAAEATRGAVLRETTELDQAAKSLMRSRGQSTNPRSANFGENFKTALLEVNPK